MPCVILKRLCVTYNKQMKPSWQEARFPQKAEIHLRGTKVCTSSYWSGAEGMRFRINGAVLVPMPREAMQPELEPHRGVIRKMDGPVWASRSAFQEPVHAEVLHSVFFTAWAPCVWEPFARVKIMHDPIFSRLFTSWRVEIPSTERKKEKKKKSSWIISAPQIAPRGK